MRFCLNAPCPFTLLNLRPSIFGLTLSGSFISIYLSSFPWKHRFWLLPAFPGTQLGRWMRSWCTKFTSFNVLSNHDDSFKNGLVVVHILPSNPTNVFNLTIRDTCFGRLRPSSGIKVHNLKPKWACVRRTLRDVVNFYSRHNTGLLCIFNSFRVSFVSLLNPCRIFFLFFDF